MAKGLFARLFTNLTVRETGEPASSNGASSFHLIWSVPPEPLDEVSATFELLVEPSVARLYFWALQCLLNINNIRYLLDTKLGSSQQLITNMPDKDFGILLSNRFLTLTGGTPYYSLNLTRKKNLYFNNSLYYLNNSYKKYSRTLIWLSEETHKINSDNNFLLIQNDNWIFKNTEILPNIYSKTSGIVSIIQKQLNKQ